MDKRELIQLLRDGSASWNKWRRSHSGHIDISRINISSSVLSYADLSYADLSGAILSNCNLAGANFLNANCTATNFESADLTDAKFGHADLERAHFAYADLSGADLSQSVGLSQEQIDEAHCDADTRLPDGISYVEYDYDDEPETDPEIFSDDSSEIPEQVVAPLQVNWRGQKLIALLDDPISNKLSPAAIASSIIERLLKLKAELKETNIDRRIFNLIDDVTDSLGDLETRRGVFNVGFATEEFQYCHDRLKGELSPILEARMMSNIVNLRNLLAAFPDWQEFEAARELSNFAESKNIHIGVEESGALIRAIASRPDVIDESISEYLEERRNSDFDTPMQRFGYFSSVVNVLAKLFAVALDGISGGAKAAFADETKNAVKWMLRASAGIVVWYITYVTGAYPWIKAAWQVIKSTL